MFVIMLLQGWKNWQMRLHFPLSTKVASAHPTIGGPPSLIWTCARERDLAVFRGKFSQRRPKFGGVCGRYLLPLWTCAEETWYRGGDDRAVLWSVGLRALFGLSYSHRVGVQQEPMFVRFPAGGSLGLRAGFGGLLMVPLVPGSFRWQKSYRSHVGGQCS